MKIPESVNTRLPEWCQLVGGSSSSSGGGFFDGYGIPIDPEREFQDIGVIAPAREFQDSARERLGRGVNYHDYMGDPAYLRLCLSAARRRGGATVSRITLEYGTARLWYAHTKHGEYYRLEFTKEQS